ncbi:hypothetical protein GJAV_G00118290 [Gymnothorax javanicus]|nr:hypothetical protein GJAV_G00118290 [Gymnothorax javanicus]
MAGEVKLRSDDVLVNALSDFLSAARKQLNETKNECSKGHPPEKVSEIICGLFGSVVPAASFFTSLSVKSRVEAEELWKTAYSRAEVRDRVEDFLQLEEDWDAFLQSQDAEQHKSDTLLRQDLKAGSLIGEMALTDARTGKTVNLAQYLGKGERLLLLETNQGLLDAQSVRVLVVSFNGLEGAQCWLQETGCKYDMLLDPERKMYAAFGLGASYTKVFNFDTMLKYAEYMVLGRQFPQARSQFVSDFYQMGGDFVLDESGRVIYSQASQTPMNRPAIAEILAGIAKSRRPSNL